MSRYLSNFLMPSGVEHYSSTWGSLFAIAVLPLMPKGDSLQFVPPVPEKRKKFDSVRVPAGTQDATLLNAVCLSCALPGRAVITLSFRWFRQASTTG